MKIGCVGLRVPADVEPADHVYWQIRRVADLGGQITGVSAWRLDAETRKRVRAFADDRGVELESYVPRIVGLVGPDADRARGDLVCGLQAARELGGPVVRSSYGLLEIPTSRFNRELPLTEHLDQLAANLRVAATIAEDQGMVIGIENHCDFTGKELATVLQEVESPAIRAALDTGNSFTVFCDPLDDLAALAPLTVTTHLKDMKIVPFKEEIRLAPNEDRVPFLAVGCALGQGHVDVVTTVQTLAEQSPRGRDLPLIVEVGWLPNSVAEDRVEAIQEAVKESLAYLRQTVPAYLSA